MRRAWILVLVLACIGASCSGDDDHERAASVTTTTSTSTTTSTTTTTEPPLTRPVVGGVGDSLMAQVEDALPGALPELDVHAEGIVGLTANDAMFAVGRLRMYAPAAAVVVLGTNDARNGPTSGDDLASIRRVVRSLGEVPCVRWTTVNESSRFADLNDGARVINQELHEQAQQRPNFGVIEWGAELAAHPEWLDPDGIHHSPEGQAAFVQRLAAALRACVVDG